MHNKKAVHGLHWDILWISSLAAIGIIIFYSSSYASVPNVGEFPIELGKELEKNSNANQKIDAVIRSIIRQSLAELTAKDISEIIQGCDNYLSYILLNKDNIQSCLNMESMKSGFIKAFQQKLDNVKPNKYLDLSGINYKVSISDKNGKFFLSGITEAELKIPLSIKKGSNEKQIGNLFVNPSFSIDTGYYFSDYDKLSKKSQELFWACKNLNIEECVNANKNHVFNDDNFGLLGSCEPEEKENFFRVVEYVEACSYSSDKSCICTQNNPSIKGSYDISKDGNDIMIADKNNPGLKQKIENAGLVDNYIYVGGASYVHKDTDGKVIISGYWTGKTCEPNPQTKFRFCVWSKNSSLYAYDENDKTAKLRPIVYRFALDFKEYSGNDILKGSSGNDILTESADIKERIRQLAQEIGFTNIDLALKLAKTESNFRHCNDGTLNCGTSNNGNVFTNGKDFGVMQINIDANSDLFNQGTQRLSLFACKQGETAYDLDCNIKSGLKILQQNYNAYGFNTERYNSAIDEFCKDSSNNAKYKSYADPWDRALRAYNGFGCNAQVAGYVEKVDSAIV